MAYSEKVIDHYENRRNVGSFGKDESGKEVQFSEMTYTRKPAMIK